MSGDLVEEKSVTTEAGDVGNILVIRGVGTTRPLSDLLPKNNGSAAGVGLLWNMKPRSFDDPVLFGEAIENVDTMRLSGDCSDMADLASVESGVIKFSCICASLRERFDCGDSCALCLASSLSLRSPADSVFE